MQPDYELLLRDSQRTAHRDRLRREPTLLEWGFAVLAAAVMSRLWLADPAVEAARLAVDAGLLSVVAVVFVSAAALALLLGYTDRLEWATLRTTEP